MKPYKSWFFLAFLPIFIPKKALFARKQRRAFPLAPASEPRRISSWMVIFSISKSATWASPVRHVANSMNNLRKKGEIYGNIMYNSSIMMYYDPNMIHVYSIHKKKNGGEHIWKYHV